MKKLPPSPTSMRKFPLKNTCMLAVFRPLAREEQLLLLSNKPLQSSNSLLNKLLLSDLLLNNSNLYLSNSNLYPSNSSLFLSSSNLFLSNSNLLLSSSLLLNSSSLFLSSNLFLSSSNLFLSRLLPSSRPLSQGPVLTTWELVCLAEVSLISFMNYGRCLF